MSAKYLILDTPHARSVEQEVGVPIVGRELKNEKYFMDAISGWVDKLLFPPNVTTPIFVILHPADVQIIANTKSLDEVLQEAAERAAR